MEREVVKEREREGCKGVKMEELMGKTARSLLEPVPQPSVYIHCVTHDGTSLFQKLPHASGSSRADHTKSDILANQIQLVKVDQPFRTSVMVWKCSTVAGCLGTALDHYLFKPRA